MSSDRYPAYKDSGVAWLGLVPAHWRIAPLYQFFLQREESNKNMVEQNLLSLSYGNIVNKDIESNDGLLPDSFETYQIIHPGDIVFRFTDMQNDKRSLRSALAKQKGIITSAYLAVKPVSGNADFYNFLFRAYDVLKVYYAMGGGLRQSMNYQEIKRLPLLLPPLAEQQAIAAFLDGECARIDALVAAQQRMIALLKEKRQALISQAVTRGLDPAVPLRDSGVAWLGQVPAHWEVKKAKYVCSMKSGESINSDVITEEGEFPVFGGNGFRGYTKQYTHSGPKILIGRQGALCGNINYAHGEFWASEHAIVVTEDETVSWRYLGELFRSMNLNQYSTAAAQPGISVEQIINLSIPLPPLAEQQVIAAFLNGECARIDALIGKAELAITLLYERRSAVIAAAVTGAIRVG